MKLLGLSSQNLPIFSYEFGTTGPKVLLLSGVHGDEPEGIYLNQGLLKKFQESFNYNLQITLIPIFNPDGTFLLKRTNGNDVDLNRNLPTKNWSSKSDNPRYYPGSSPGSESENKALIHWIETHKPKIIFTFHSWNPVLNVNGDCEPEASILSKETGYKISKDIGYPTPGSLGEYCGLERNIPTITYEVERGSNARKVLSLHVPAMEKALLSSEKRT